MKIGENKSFIDLNYIFFGRSDLINFVKWDTLLYMLIIKQKYVSYPQMHQCISFWIQISYQNSELVCIHKYWNSWYLQFLDYCFVSCTKVFNLNNAPFLNLSVFKKTRTGYGLTVLKHPETRICQKRHNDFIQFEWKQSCFILDCNETLKYYQYASGIYWYCIMVWKEEKLNFGTNVVVFRKEKLITISIKIM